MLDGHGYLFGQSLRAQPYRLRELLDAGLRVLCFPWYTEGGTEEDREKSGDIAVAEKTDKKYIIKIRGRESEPLVCLSKHCSEKEFHESVIKYHIWFIDIYEHINHKDIFDKNGNFDKSKKGEILDYLAQSGFLRSYGKKEEDCQMSPFQVFVRDYPTIGQDGCPIIGQYLYKKGDVNFGVQFSSIIDPFSYRPMSWKEFFTWLYS